MRNRLALATVIAATIAASGVAAPAAQAAPQGNWDAPPTCFQGAEWHFNNHDPATGVGDQMGLYDYNGEITEQVFYGGGYETRHYWVYTVSVPVAAGPAAGMQDAGVAYKHCGTTWTPTSA